VDLLAVGGRLAAPIFSTTLLSFGTCMMLV